MQPVPLRTEVISGVKPSRLRLLLYGPGKIGKTRLAATAPKPLFFDFDDGAGALTGVTRIRPQTMADFEGMCEQLKLDRGAGFETIVLDTVTFHQIALTEEILKRLQSTRMGFDGWTMMKDFYIRCWRLLDSLPCHLILVAHVDVGQVDGRTVQEPAIQGKMNGILQGACDSIGYMTGVVRSDGKGPARYQRCLRFRTEDGSFICGDRYDVWRRDQHGDITELSETMMAVAAGSPAETPARPPRVHTKGTAAPTPRETPAGVRTPRPTPRPKPAPPPPPPTPPSSGIEYE